MKFEYAVGATPLNQDEVEGLIPVHIATQNELNEWEASNILTAENWLFSTRHRGNFLTIEFLKSVHKKMFNTTWKWAGDFRNSDKNIGVMYAKISSEMRILLDDVIYQIENNTYSIDEIAYRFHHRLVYIHPFANGNGRHARLMTDFLLVKAGSSKFTWGTDNLVNQNETRKAYIEALKQADKRDYSLLAKFVRA